MASKQQVLILFDALFDTDQGVIKTMLTHYANPKFLLAGVEKLTKEQIKILLFARRHPNPLTAILKEEYHKDIADSLYKQLFEKEEEHIIEGSHSTAITKVIKGLMATNANMDFYVLCKNDREKAIANQLGFENTIDMPEDAEKFDIDQYDNFFVKDFTQMCMFKPTKEKNIFIARLMINLQPIMGELVPRMDLSMIIGRLNKIMVIDYYEGISIEKYTEKKEEKGEK